MRLRLREEIQGIHQPVRLQIMGLLFRQRDVGFAEARDVLGVTEGNLGAHASVLEQAGFLETRRLFSRQGTQLRYRITEKGSEAFREYVQVLQEFLRL